MAGLDGDQECGGLDVSADQAWHSTLYNSTGLEKEVECVVMIVLSEQINSWAGMEGDKKKVTV